MTIFDDIAFHNVSELEKLPGGLRKLHRFPAALRDGLGIPGHQRGRFYAHRLAGVELRFVTPSPFVSLSLMALEADTHVVVYRGDFAHARYELSAGRVTTLFLENPPFFDEVAETCLAAGRFSANIWRVVFHQDAQAAYLSRNSFGEEIRPPHPHELPGMRWLAYGSSITFGANALHPATGYVRQAPRRLGVDVLNLGLPGSCMAEPAMAAYLAERQDCDLLTCELGVNMVGWIDPPEFESRIRHLLATVADRRPNRPVCAMNLFSTRGDWLRNHSNVAAEHTAAFNRIVAKVVQELGRSNLHFVDGRDILPDSDGLTSDLLHPSDEGHIRMGERLATLLRPHLP
jgi:lysophospholipase L1-like esterase